LSSYELALTSLCHGADVVHVATGLPVAGTEARAVAACAKCGREFLITALLRPLSTTSKSPDLAFGERQGCGTAAGYRRHQRRGQPACGPCREAWARRSTPAGRMGKRETVWL
jgi:hypothetical protein